MSKQYTFEKLHSKFCKQTLGLDQQTPDIMGKAELGRIPIMAAIIKRCYGYWQHLLNTNSQSFTHTALQANINFDRRGWDSYYSRNKSLLATLEIKDKIYPVPKKMIKSEAQKFCIKYKELYISNFFQFTK